MCELDLLLFINIKKFHIFIVHIYIYVHSKCRLLYRTVQHIK